MEGRIEIENASRVGKECAETGWARRFIRRLGLGRGCKVRVKLGSHHRTGRIGRIWGYPETRIRQAWRMRGSGRPGAPSPAPPEVRRFGATRRCAAGTAGGCEFRSSAGAPSPGSPEGESFEETRRSISRRRGSEDSGNPENHRRQSWKMQDSGTPEDSSQGGTGGAEIRGAPEIHRQSR